MKYYLVPLLLLLTGFGYSQIEKQTGDFHKVTVFDQIDVLLVPGTENKVILDGEGAEDVELVTKNGELKIRMPLTKLLKGDTVSATVFYTDINAVEANEGSRLATEKTIYSTHFEIIAKEGSEIQLPLQTEKLNLKILSGSSVTVEGLATVQEAVLNSGSMYFGSKCKTKQTTVTVNAGGAADIFATDYVNAKVRAGGEVSIFGKPKQIDQQTFAGGSIAEVE